MADRTDRTDRTSFSDRSYLSYPSYRSYPPPEQAPSSGMPSALMAVAVEAGSSCHAYARQMPAHAPPPRQASGPMRPARNRRKR